MTRAFFLFVTWVFLIFLLFSIKVAPVAAVEFYFTILHTNDEHSALIPIPRLWTTPRPEGNVHATRLSAGLRGWPGR